MPKRSCEEKMEYYIKKLEKLKDKYHSKRRRLNESISSEDNDNQVSENATWQFTVPETESEPLPGPVTDEEMLPDPTEPQSESLMESRTIQQNDLTQEPPSESLPPDPPLDPELLSALGEATELGSTWGQDIQGNLAQLWQPLLKKGMAKESKDKLLKKYLIPSNCTLLQAPRLNIEISAAVNDMVRLRDKKVETSQQQLGYGITAISRAITSLLTSDNKVEAIKTLSDGCRILCDLHHAETQARIKMLTPGLAKPFLNIIQDSDRDETLFGTDLPEKIKASKTIEKQGLQIKRALQPARSNSAVHPQFTNMARQQFQGNLAGPSRYPINRGGRGGQKMFPASARRPTSTTTSQLRPNQSRQRAPVRQ